MFGAAAAGVASFGAPEKMPEKPTHEHEEAAGLQAEGDGMIEVAEPDLAPGSEGSDAALSPEARAALKRSGYTDLQIDQMSSGNIESTAGEPDSMSREEIKKLEE